MPEMRQAEFLTALLVHQGRDVVALYCFRNPPYELVAYTDQELQAMPEGALMELYRKAMRKADLMLTFSLEAAFQMFFAGFFQIFALDKEAIAQVQQTLIQRLLVRAAEQSQN